MRKLSDLISRLKTARVRFGNMRQEFWAAHKDEYFMLAHQVAERELTMARPDDMSEEEWVFRVSVLSGGIAANLLNDDEAGLVIFISSRPQGQFEEIVGPSPGIYSRDTVLEWIAAGRAGDEAGKHLDDRDAGNTDEQIAQRVWWALYTGRSMNSSDRIRTYLTERQFEQVKDHMEPLLAAWVEAIIPRVRADWREHVKMVMAGRSVARPF